MNKLKIYDRRTELHKEIKYLVCFMAGICVCGIGFRIEAKLAEPTWAEQQVVLAVPQEDRDKDFMNPLIDTCEGFNCMVQKAYAVEPEQEEKPEVKEFQLSDRALDCVANHPETAKKISEKFGKYGQYAIELYARESSLNYLAKNGDSGACGLVQAYPCSKMGCDLTDLDCQLEWGYVYLTQRYGDAKNALEFHNNNGWY